MLKATNRQIIKNNKVQRCYDRQECVVQQAVFTIEMKHQIQRTNKLQSSLLLYVQHILGSSSAHCLHTGLTNWQTSLRDTSGFRMMPFLQYCRIERLSLSQFIAGRFFLMPHSLATWAESSILKIPLDRRKEKWTQFGCWCEQEESTAAL